MPLVRLVTKMMVFPSFPQEKIPVPPDNEKIKKLGRNAAIGFVASVVSDTTSNSLRQAGCSQILLSQNWKFGG